MKIIILLIGLISLFYIKTEAQTNQTNNVTRISFIKGLCLQSPETVVPWGATFDEIKKYGSPLIYCARKTNTKVLWDSVYIFDSIKVSLWTFYFKCFQKHKPTRKLTTIYGSIDSNDISRIKIFLDEYSTTSGVLSKWENTYSYYWIIDNCNVKLGYAKNRGAFFDIQTRNRLFW